MPATTQTPIEAIRSVYERLAPAYDRSGWIVEALLLRRLRRELLSRVRCRGQCQVLEVGIGTGVNLQFYPPTAVIHGIDLSAPMLERAMARAHRLGRHVHLETMNAERLAFPDQSFDSVVSTLTMCTTPDPLQLLREMGRVCRPDGRVLFLEHGESTIPVINWALHRLAPGHLRRYACHLTRDVVTLPGQAGLCIVDSRRYLFGVFALIEAAPPPPIPL
jgi:ubiquinone/menaquinone biosynthesis C-methylase UbiE